MNLTEITRKFPLSIFGAAVSCLIVLFSLFLFLFFKPEGATALFWVAMADVLVAEIFFVLFSMGLIHSAANDSNPNVPIDVAICTALSLLFALTFVTSIPLATWAWSSEKLLPYFLIWLMFKWIVFLIVLWVVLGTRRASDVGAPEMTLGRSQGVEIAAMLKTAISSLSRIKSPVIEQDSLCELRSEIEKARMKMLAYASQLDAFSARKIMDLAGTIASMASELESKWPEDATNKTTLMRGKVGEILAITSCPRGCEKQES